MVKFAMSVLLSACGVMIGACEQSAPAGSTSSTPPADAKYIEEGIEPVGVASSVWSQKGDDARKKAAEQWAGLWIPAPGWEGTVEKLEYTDGGTNVWFSYAAMPQMGGNFWVAAEFPGNTREIREAQSLEFTGRIEKVELLRPAGTLQVRIVVRNAKILTVNGK
jgi:hypothetical protein